MVLPETGLSAPPGQPTAFDEQPTGASGTRLKVATRPATVGATWLDLFHPGTPSRLGLEARVRVIADIAGALIQIHDNSGIPRQHRRHGRLTPRHLLIGVDGSASLFTTKEPFSKLLPPQPDLGYLAPELLTQVGPANQQSDIFSMGVLLWEALDNGRLFPHRRAAAISRLIARRSLPTPRIEEEWALPLAEVAMKALANDPEERYPDATAFWLALREHLPAPDNARAALSRLAQRALKLELTTEIRETPPYLVPSPLLLTTSLPPERSSALDAVTGPESSARYSLRPEPSTRQRGTSRPPTRPPSEDPAWSLSDTPPTPSQLGHSRAEDRASPVPEPSTRWTRSSDDEQLEPNIPVGAPPTSARPRPANEPLASAPVARASSEPPVSTLHVNLPRDLVDASLPFYVSSQPAPRPFPWGALSFAALMFFGVGAAVAFGAVTALRSVPTSAHTPAVMPPGTQLPPAAAVPAPAAVAGSAAVRQTTENVAPGDMAAPAKTEAAASEPEQTAATLKPESANTGKARTARQSARRASKSAKARAHAPKLAAPAPEAQAEPEPNTEPGESLPFVEQPYE